MPYWAYTGIGEGLRSRADPEQDGEIQHRNLVILTDAAGET